MLAQTFKTAAELGIPDQERNALVTVLYMIEDGQIKPELIFMGAYHASNALCGTTHCLAGWAYTVDNTAFPELGPNGTRFLRKRVPDQLAKLFGIEKPTTTMSMSNASPARAARALRAYLETGICP